jgi:DNA/RNA-binding domain of Phe-tRNA-synthetase-like protein
MHLQVNFDSDASKKMPQLAICLGSVSNVHVEQENQQIQNLHKFVYAEVRNEHNIEELKNNPTIRAYRDFYWKLDIDPTKTRPSGEALLRRVLNGNNLPRISTVVDAYNLASMRTIIPISGFDGDRLDPPFKIRFARNNETFTGIGMTEPMNLTDKMLVLTDKKQVLCIYPHRDSDFTKISLQTKNVLVIGYGAPGITDEQLRTAVENATSYIKLVSGGEIEATKLFKH